MNQYLTYISNILGNNYVSLGIMMLTICFKLIVLGMCVRYLFRTKSHRALLACFIVFLIGIINTDLACIIFFVIRQIYKVSGTIPNLHFLIRMAWVFYMTQYQAIAAFFEYLIHKKIRKNLFFYSQVLINIAISSGFLYLAVFKYHVPSSSPETLAFEQNLSQASTLALIFMFGVTFYTLFRRTQKNEIPVILNHQIRLLASFFIPYLILELLPNSSPYIRWIVPISWIHQFTFVPLTNLLSSIAIYIVIRKIMGLRFMNISQTVESKEKFNFLSQFRDILEQLSYATALKELAQLTQTFFQTAFNIPIGRIRLYVRKADSEIDEHSHFDIINTANKVEQYIGKHENQTITRALRSTKIFVRDDVHFNYFYEDDPMSKEILQFLDVINADVFLPIFERNEISAYIIVEQDARPGKLFTNKERDEMLVFTTYLSNIINILKYSNLEALHLRHKQLNEELYHKHQEINQYKESIRTFMRSNTERKIGILFYRYRRFTVANEAAQELIGIDLNMNEGHPLTQTIRQLARRVQEYKTSQTTVAQDPNGQKIIVTGIPSIEERATILLIHYPEVSDILKTHFGQLKDPSTWDYVLYLETTQSGQIINQLIPGNSEKLLNFKIQLLSTALSKKATLLALPEEDLMPTVEVLHEISLRQTLHTIILTHPEKNDEVALKLFGSQSLINYEGPLPLLEKLDNTGTLFIQNIEYLSPTTQEYLAEFISFGYFHKFKSDHKVFSNVRVICSSTRNLLELVNDDTFSRTLYQELEQTSLTMPSLQEFSENELTALAQGFADQIITEGTYKNLLTLTDKDKSKLYDERPLSLREFKERVHQLLVLKSSKHKISEVTKFDPAYNVTDPDIAQAVRLGKKALKNPHIMSMLWQKFKNQSKIATLLGVNRSSVNRRCQEYNLK